MINKSNKTLTIKTLKVQLYCQKIFFKYLKIETLSMLDLKTTKEKIFLIARTKLFVLETISNKTNVKI